MAVTKGLDGDAPQVDSGIAWIGSMPVGWRSEKLKRMSPEITVGVVVMPSQYYVDDGVIALRSFNVQPMTIDPRDPVYFSPATNDQLKKSKLNSGDLVAVRTGNPGTTAVVSEELDGVNCIDLIIIRKSEQFDSKFLVSVRQVLESAESIVIPWSIADSLEGFACGLTRTEAVMTGAACAIPVM